MQPLPEVAFAGRSNVGKSSAINRLLRVNRAARVSRQPGRTQAINLFEVEGRLVFADLPGYGFARVPEAIQAGWKGLVEGYLGEREALRLVVVLVDCRLEIQTMDAELVWGLREARLPLALLLTKFDKLGRNAGREVVRKAGQAWGLPPERCIPFSAHDGLGVEAAWAVIDAALRAEVPS